jgi:hypothetical protein
LPFLFGLPTVGRFLVVICERNSIPFLSSLGIQLALVNELCAWFSLSWVFHVFTIPKRKSLLLGGHWPSCLRSELVLVTTSPQD